MVRALLAAATALLVAIPASPQITAGVVSGTIVDAQRGAIPGATVVLISESRGTRGVPAVSNQTGSWTFPNTTPDTYTVEVTMSGFKTLARRGVHVSAGDRVSVGALVIAAGASTETVEVTAEVARIQAESGERSFAVSTAQIENLPIHHGNFTNFVTLVPGVRPRGNLDDDSRIGGGGQNNLMIDGVSAMDTGSNGQMLDLNVESIAEVKVLTSSYQAEYGRSSGLQITAVTKNGTNRFHGSLYDIETNSDWDSNSWVNEKNGDPKTRNETKSRGYWIGGPVGKPGGENKLFFFYSHEYRPTTTAGMIHRLRVPTALERAGDFSQTVDNHGRPFPYIKDPNVAGTCSASDRTACFAAGGVLGRIPQDRLYQVGLNILDRYPLPTIDQVLNTNYNYESVAPTLNRMTQQPAVRLDYQLSPALRVSGRYSGERERRFIAPGSIPGFNDADHPDSKIHNGGVTANYTVNSTTVIEGMYGLSQNRLAGEGNVGIQVAASANRLNSGLAGLPLLYPNAGVVDTRSYQYEVLTETAPAYFDGERVLLPPRFQWGDRVGAAPPNQQYPGSLSMNRTQDVAISLTKVAGSHTIKVGFYNHHSWKTRNVNGGGGNQFEGVLNFGESTNNPLDTQHGFANAALGVFQEYQQQSRLLEGNFLSDNRELYAQDNWKITRRLTLDYGVRLVNQTPQSEQSQQMSNFFPDQWSLSSAPLLYTAGCTNGEVSCAGDLRNAKNPVTGEILTIPGLPNTQALIGTVIPESGNMLNGIRRAGDGISNDSYTWPTLGVAPRLGAAYGLTGSQSVVVRGGVGLFFDRPDGNTVFRIPGNPPMASSTHLYNGRLQELGEAASIVGAPSLNVYEYDSKLPSSTQWNAGTQMVLPWASSIDVAYVGQHAFNRLGAFQGGSAVNLNAVDLGAAYLPENQDLTRGYSTVPAAVALPANNMRAFRGLDTINQQRGQFHETFHSIQASLNRRFTRGVQFGVNYLYTISHTGNTGLQLRMYHLADGTVVERADQQLYEDINKNLNDLKHVIKGNFVLDLPNLTRDAGAMRALGYLVNDWQLSGVVTAGSTGRYDLTYSYQNEGGNVNLTGSPDYGARIQYVGDPGSGCSADQYKQFDAAAVVGPQYGSVGLESGRNVLAMCPDRTVDLSLARTIPLGGGRSVQLRLDAFNAFNAVIINNRQNQLQLVSPTNMTILNSQTLADGSIDPTRLTPRTAGFGAATGAQSMRSIQLTGRFSF